MVFFSFCAYSSTRRDTMCGISGWIDFDKKIDHEKSIQQDMLKSMLHRGNDEQGLYSETHLQLHHARLCIMDVMHGLQPMHYKQYVMVYNGEIYNC